jgi:hypothetical protein
MCQDSTNVGWFSLGDLVLILSERCVENWFESSRPCENRLGELKPEFFHKKNQMDENP